MQVAILQLSAILLFVANTKEIKVAKNTNATNPSLTLLSDNTNNYLCDPQEIVSASSNSDAYQFACSQGGDLECPSNYIMKCIVYASYGNTAGSCSELSDNPYGCGFTRTVTCANNFSCVGDHGGEIDSCWDTTSDSVVYTHNPCTDCLPMCGCTNGLYNAPQFYNVADCFGDKNSRSCNSENAIQDTVYLPNNLFHKYCHQQESCYIELVGQETKCTDDDGNEQIYYDSVFVSSTSDQQGHTQQFANFTSNIIDNNLSQCTPAKLKILALCTENE